MSTTTHSPLAYRRPIAPRGPSLETWLIRAGYPPATAALLAAHAGFRLRDDYAACHVDGAEAPSIGVVSTSPINRVEVRHV